MSANVLGQRQYAVRFDWGLPAATATSGDVAVVVDVLSFSTSVCIECERGAVVYPYPWGDRRAEEFAQRHAAVPAVGRLEAGKGARYGTPSLSSAALLNDRPYERLVLPSLNGSTITAALVDSGAQVALGCLRNAAASVRWIAEQLPLQLGLVVPALREGFFAGHS